MDLVLALDILLAQATTLPQTRVMLRNRLTAMFTCATGILLAAHLDHLSCLGTHLIVVPISHGFPITLAPTMASTMQGAHSHLDPLPPNATSRCSPVHAPSCGSAPASSSAPTMALAEALCTPTQAPPGQAFGVAG